MTEFTVSEDVEIVLDGKRFLLEKGDVVSIEETRGAAPSIDREKAKQAGVDARIDAGQRVARPFKVIEDRDREVLASIISELTQSTPMDRITVKDVIELYNEKFDPRNKQAGLAFDPKTIENMIKETAKQQMGLLRYS